MSSKVNVGVPFGKNKNGDLPEREAEPLRAISPETLETTPPSTAKNNSENGVARTSLGREHRSNVLASIQRIVPPLLMIGALAGLGYVGHRYSWHVPKFSELTGRVPPAGVAWCDEHGVPEVDCISCNADLKPKTDPHGWCAEHGVHECVLHYPDTAQLAEVPVISSADTARAARAIAFRPRTKNDPACKMHLRRIQFPSVAAVDKAGIDIGLADRGRIVEVAPATGEIVFDPTRVARLATRAAGTVWRVEKGIGDRVSKGEVLALIDAADVGRAKADLNEAVVQLELHEKTCQRLAELDGVITGARLIEAESLRAIAEVAVQKAIQSLVNLGLPITLDEVRQTTSAQLNKKLKFLGLPTSLIEQFDPDRTTSNLIPVIAPRDGVVISRDVAAGEMTDVSKTMFTIVDTSRVWLSLNVRTEDSDYLAVGQTIIFRPDGTDRTFTGALTWISTEVDRETRTVSARGELPNVEGHLRNETFGSGEIILREDDQAILVPSSAVHWEGCCHVVFVRDKDFLKDGSFKVFHTRSVRPGIVMGDQTEIIAGVLPGEVVVTKGSGVLRAELLKGDLGAG